MRPSVAIRLRNESEAGTLYRLACGAFGSHKSLFQRAKLEGFNGSYVTFGERLRSAGGSKSLKELSTPVDKRLATSKKRVQSDEVADAIRALDARKAAMR